MSCERIRIKHYSSRIDLRVACCRWSALSGMEVYDGRRYPHKSVMS